MAMGEMIAVTPINSFDGYEESDVLDMNQHYP